jgi:hypothetical protein
VQNNLAMMFEQNRSFDANAMRDNPFVAKLDPETKLYSGTMYGLGFDHVMDVLRQDIAARRIRPEQLNKLTVDQAVRRTQEYNLDLARKMRKDRALVRADLPVYKEYPEEGFKWVQLTRPGDFADESRAMGHSVKGYEPPSGHPDWTKGSGDEGSSSYGYGGWEGIKSGRAKVYSLVDAKGEPHVTIETKAPDMRSNYDELQPLQRQADLEADAQNFQTFAERDKFVDKRYQELKAQMMAQKKPQGDYTITQIKGKQNAKPKDEYLPFVQDFVRGSKWSDIRDFKNTGLIREGDQIMTPAEHADWLLKELGADTYNELGLGAKIPPAEGMKRGGKVSISSNPDTMMLEVNNQKMKNGVPAYAGAGLIKGGLKAARPAISEAERALPLVLPRALPKSKAEINAHAERVARQMMGEHVTSGKAGDTRNLAGRSMKESQRVKGLEYEIVPTKDVPESQVYQPQIGDINMALPGDFTLSDVELKSLQGEPVGSRQQGGSRYGLGHMEAETPLFYASNEVPAQGVQNKATDLSNLFGADRIIGQHMAMGPVATNFAQHFADANLRYTDYSKLRPQDMYEFDKIISEGFVTSKKDKKTGETIYKIVDFPDWPGIADPQSALAAMENNPEMRKWYNRVMQTPKITEPLGFPSGQDVRYAITSPELRDMEVNLTGHGVGRLVPNAPLTDTAQHATYSKGIPGLYLGHQEVLTPFAISYPDAAQHIISTKNPQDFTGTIQKVFPHQRVDQQFMDEMDQYRRRIKELTGKKEGGYIKKPAAYIDGSEFVEAAQKYGLNTDNGTLNKLVALVNQGATVDEAARTVSQETSKATGGAIAKMALKAAPAPKAPQIIKPSGLTELKRIVEQEKGGYGARRLERAADEIPNLEKLYNERALKDVFTGDNARALMTMNPKDFGKYAMPLDSREHYGYESQSEYIDKLAKLVGGFYDVPFLEINKREQGAPVIPFISGHEGRHRSRALESNAEPASLVRLLPRSELREPFPRRSQEEYIDALKQELEITGNKVTPEKYFDNFKQKELKRSPIILPDIYAKGGAVKPEVKKAYGGAINYNTAPDMSDGGRIIQGAPFKRGGKVIAESSFAIGGLIKVTKKRKAKA